jgi:hypothetical protein
MNRLAAIALSFTFSLLGVTVAESYSDRKITDIPPTTGSTAASSSTLPTTTTTTTTVHVSPDAQCPMWWSLALSVGFTDEQMPTLDRIMYRESRCDPTQLNATDPNGGSISLTQINRFWCLPSRYYPSGYLQSVGVLDTCDDLYEPEINLRAALALVEYSESVGLSSWHQWAWL